MCVLVFAYMSTILTSSSPVRFIDQYLSIGTSLPNNYSIYGLGEHILDSFRLRYCYSVSLKLLFHLYLCFGFLCVFWLLFFLILAKDRH